MPTKALEGGPQGVAALAAAVDLGKALQLTNMDLDSLADEHALPQSEEALAAKAAAKAARRGGSVASLRRPGELRAGCASCSCLDGFGLGCGAAAAAGQGEEDVAAEAAAAAAVGGGAQQGCWPCRQQQPLPARSSSAGSQASVQQEGVHWRQLVTGLTPAASQEVAADAAAGGPLAAVKELAAAALPVKAAALGAAGTVATGVVTAVALSPVGKAAVGATELAGAAAGGVAAAVAAATSGAGQAAAGEPQLERLTTAISELTMRSALSHPDDLVLDEGSGAWVQLALAGSGGGGGGGGGGRRRPEQRLDLSLEPPESRGA